MFFGRRRQGPLTLAFTAVILALVFGSMVYTSVNEPSVMVKEGVLKIDTPLYGVSQPLNEITDIKISNDKPYVTNKTNGIGLGAISRGWFDVTGMGNGRLYIHSDSTPFVYITTKDSFIIMNFSDPAKTQKLFDDLTANWKKQ